MILVLVAAGWPAAAGATAATWGHASDPAPQKAPVVGSSSQPSPNPAPQAEVRSTISHTSVPRVVERVDDQAGVLARHTALSVSSFWSRTPASRPEVTPRYTPAITTSVMAKNSGARRLAIERSSGS